MAKKYQHSSRETKPEPVKETVIKAPEPVQPLPPQEPMLKINEYLASYSSDRALDNTFRGWCSRNIKGIHYTKSEWDGITRDFYSETVKD